MSVEGLGEEPHNPYLSAAPIPILQFDEADRLVYANKAANSVLVAFGLSLNAVVNDPDWRQKLAESRASESTQWHLSNENESFRCTLCQISNSVVVYAFPLSIEYALTAAFNQDPHPLLRTRFYGTLVYANHASSYILDNWSVRVGDKVPRALDLTKTGESGKYDELIVGSRTYLVHPVRVVGHDAIFVYFNDITQTKALNKFPEQNPNPVLKVSVGSIITYANSASADILERWETKVGCQVPEIVSRALPTDARPRELTITCGDRIYKLNLVYVSALQSINVYATDMTAFYELEEARANLIRKEKLAALGSMVAGVAHELNTPIGVTLTAAEMLNEATDALSNRYLKGELTQEGFLDSLKQLGEISSLIQMNARKAADLIQSFKGVAVDHARVGVRAMQIKGYLERIVRSLSPYLLKQNIEVAVEGPDLHVTVHAGPLSQVVTNLLQNTALHAYQGRGGKVVIRIHEIVGDELKISFIDEGVGIDPETLSRIFEPLFTTKLGQGGSGLGLHICYTTVRDILKGTIDVESELGEGTAFHVRFPIQVNDGNDEDLSSG